LEIPSCLDLRTQSFQKGYLLEVFRKDEEPTEGVGREDKKRKREGRAREN
jgi:hypothetical protein